MFMVSKNRKSVIQNIERGMARTPFLKFIIQRWMIEVVARMIASFLAMTLRKSRYGIERRVRGFFSTHYYGGSNLKIDRNLQIEGHNALRLGDGVFLFGGSHFVAHHSNPITVGDRSHIGRNSVLAGLGGISIGDDCLISSGVLIYSITQNVEKDPLNVIRENGNLKKPVSIGNDIWIGAGATILPGVTVGDHAIIAAGAVVTKDIRPWQIAVGVPAKSIKDRRHLENISRDYE